MRQHFYRTYNLQAAFDVVMRVVNAGASLQRIVKGKGSNELVICYKAEECLHFEPQGQAAAARLSPKKVVTLRALANGGMTNDELATIYGVPEETIRDAVEGVTWKGV